MKYLKPLCTTLAAVLLSTTVFAADAKPVSPPLETIEPLAAVNAPIATDNYVTQYSAKDAKVAKVMKMLADWINFQQAYDAEKNGIDKVTVDENFLVNLEAELLTLTRMAENGEYREREALLVALNGLGAFQNWYSEANEKLVSRGMALRYQNLREKAQFLANQLELILMPRGQRSNSQNIDYALYLKLADQEQTNKFNRASDKMAQAKVDNAQNEYIAYVEDIANAAAKVVDDNYPIRIGEVVRLYSAVNKKTGETEFKVMYGENLIKSYVALIDDLKIDRMSDGAYQVTFTRKVARDVPSQQIVAWVDVRPKTGEDEFGKFVTARVIKADSLAPIDAEAAAVNPLQAMPIAKQAKLNSEVNAKNINTLAVETNANTKDINTLNGNVNTVNANLNTVAGKVNSNTLAIEDAHSRIDNTSVTVTGTTDDRDTVQTGFRKTIRNVRATAVVSAPARKPVMPISAPRAVQ